METNKLIRKDYMHVAVCLAMAVLSVGSALGGVFSSAKPNPEYIKWQKRRHSVPVQSTPASTPPKTRLLAASGEDEVFNPRFTEGVEPSYIDFSYLNAINNRDVMGVADPLPGRHDPRDDYTLTPVRQQDPQDTGIGTCWAQASVGSMETWLAVNGLGQHQFSVKNMVNLIGYDRGTDASNPRGWFGGNAIMAAAYLLRWGGPVWESNDPYTNKYGVLNYSLVSDEFQPQYHVQQMRIVPARTGSLDNEALKRAILEFGGLYATMKLYTPYYTYKGNTYLLPYWNANGAYYCPETGAGHAVTLVGWDDDYPKENFNSEYRPKGNGAFIVKDSYGTETPRDNGYIYVSYYDTTFAYSESYAFPQLEDTDNYATIYQYDTLGLVDSYVSLSSAYAANIFTAKADCLLDAVGFYAVVPNEPYTLSVYVGCKASNPTDGEVKVEQSGVTDSYAGYYTVKLDEPVSVRKGQRFSIVMKLTSSKLYPIPVEMAYEDYSSEATASAGQSFVRINPTDSWLDMTEVIHGTANFCCKAYTKSATAAKPTLLSITVKPEDGKTASIKSGDSVQMKCEAMYSNNSKSNVTDGVNWSLTSGRDYATLSSRGLLTAKNIAVLEPQTVTVQAVYAENGIVATNKFGFSMAATPPVAPMEVSATQGADSSCVRVSWAAPVGATEYAVYRATANNSKNAQHLENVTIAKYNDTKAVPGTDYWYFVKAKNSSGTSGFSGSANGWRKLAPPDNATATDNLLDKVALEWNEVDGAAYYRVYRAESIDGAKVPISAWQNKTVFDDTTAAAGITYYYYVVASIDASGNRPSDYSIVEDGMKAVPVTVDYLEINGDASITSGGYADYSADAIYTDGHKVADVSPVTWTLSGNGATLSGNRVAAATVTANSSVTLSATYTVDGKNTGGTKEIAIVATKPSTPTGLAITSQSTAGIVLGWQTAAGASSYNVYRDSSPIGSASGMTFTDNTATPGVTYSYSITAVNSAGESAMSGTVSAMIPLSAPMGVKASHDNATAVMLSWTGANGATHYRVARAANATGTKTELGTWQAATTFADTTAEPGIEYVYFVKAATDAGATVTSEWSEGVKGKILYEAPTLQALVIGGPDRIAASGTGMYSCAAVFSDDTKNIVAPEWAISSTAAATINPSGEVTAKAVSADAKVTITASYGGMQANRQIVIVAPLEAASATVSDVSVAPRWPFGTKVDIDYTLDTTPAGMRALVTLSGYDNDHRKEMPAVTIAGDSANQAVLAGRHRLTWDVGADYPGFHAKSFDVNLKAEPYVIGVPSNVTASQGSSTKAVELSWEAVEGATCYEIWRSLSPSVDSASNIVTVVEDVAFDDLYVDADIIYYYWLRAITEYGASDFGECVQGYRSGLVLSVPTDVSASKPKTISYNFQTGWYSDNAYLTNYVEVSWSSVGNATAYEIYRSWTNDVNKAEYLATTPWLTYNDTKTNPGEKNYYWVRAVAGEGVVGQLNDGSYKLSHIFGYSGLSECDYGWKGLQPPLITSITYGAVEDGGSVAWQPVEGASEYGILSMAGFMNAIMLCATIHDCHLPYTEDNPPLSDLDETNGLPIFLSTVELTKENMGLWCIIAYSSNVGSECTSKVYMMKSEISKILATHEDYDSAKVEINWNHAAYDNVLGYEVWRSPSSNYTATATKIAEVTTKSFVDTNVTYRVPYSYKVCAKYPGGVSLFSSTYAYGYWGDWCLAEVAPTGVDLRPLKSLLNLLDFSAVGNRDGYLDDIEITRATKNAGLADLDGDNNNISTAEMSVFTRIQALNTDKELLSHIMKGDYTYRNMTLAQFRELQSISDAIKELTKNRGN